ncbi:MAG: glycosyltransferase, partial [Desulfococcaceae bacterium]
TALAGRLATALTGTRLVYHVHSPTSCDTTLRWRNLVNSASERFSLAGAQKLICVSRSLAGHMLRRGYPEQRVVVVPNGGPPPEPPGDSIQ